LLAYARQWVGCQDDAEDVFQEAFVRFWRRGSGARDRLAYLYRCVRNAAMNWRRDRARRQRREQAPRDRPAPADPAVSAEQGERWDQIHQALGRLPPEQREIVAMKVWSEMSFEQIGQVLSMPKSTAHAKYRAAMGELWARVGREN
jgi:RNA polymerase sigma-70 factor (ECF subfamily)